MNLPTAISKRHLMQSLKQLPQSKKALIAVFLVILIGAGAALAWNFTRSEPAYAPPETTVSLAALEAQYGLRVNLVAVTAAGGMVDVRMKVLDSDKAKPLVLAPTGPPTLWIADGGVSLAANTDPRDLESLFESGNLFLLYPNAQGIVKPGTPVSVVLGNLKTEPIVSK